MTIRPAKRDIDPDAKSHAGDHGDFAVLWVPEWGWAVVVADATAIVGPFHTSQAAHGAAKDAIDQLIREEMKQ